MIGFRSHATAAPERPIMRKLNTHSYSWEGYWWLPDLEERHPGILSYFPADGFILKLLSEGFESPYVEVDIPATRFTGEVRGARALKLRDSIYPAIYGSADGRFVTILNVMSIQSSRKHGAQTESASSSYKASAVVEGAHIPSEDTAVIKSASVSIDNLHLWLGAPEELSVMTSIDRVNPTDNVDLIEVRTSRKLGPKHGAILECGTAVTISRNWILPSLRWSTNSYESQAQEFAQIKFDPPTPWSLMDVHKHAWEMSGLITLALDRPCAPHTIDLVIKNPTNDQSASYLTHRTTGDNSEEFVREYNPSTFTCDETRFETVVPKWFAFCQKHGEVLNLFTTLKNGTIDYLETSVFLAAILAEAFHKGVFGRKKSITNQAKDLAEEIFPEDTKPYSLFKRLVDLYCRAPQAVAHIIIPDIKTWSREHVNARNSISHEAGLGEASPRSAWAAAEVTLALVTVHLLVIIGVSDSVIEQALTESPTFRKVTYSSKKYLNVTERDIVTK